MQNRYSGDIGDFGKFLLLKHLFPKESIATIWYLYPDETHNNDGSHRVEECNINLYCHCYGIDRQMAELFHQIHQRDSRHIDLFEEMSILENDYYFTERVLGEGEGYRTQWLKRAIEFIRSKSCSVVCLDPDNGIEPSSMNKLSILKQGKYTTYAEIESFFTLECVNHLVIYQHFHRQQSHEMQMREAKATFERLYEGRAVVTIIRHNPVQARFYILLSKHTDILENKQSLEQLMYGPRAFFSVF
ncbi:hypothetical protein [Sulfuricurvum sp.]|uniref:hypothetical protein n=1 Tax=Sulfuricurvum sp. TaxID=2025608 RepID=UPI002D640323|nr:hypothetical protein [Sulfuricurvum sp.]HZF70096.1 hypothetical protein [Sulfuricurvum sp.]